MNYQQLLASYGLSADTVSVKVKSSIKAYQRLLASIEQAKQELPTANERKKVGLERLIAEGEEALPELDTEICRGIENYNKHKDRYQGIGARLTASRQKNKGKAQQTNEPVIETATESTPAAQTQPTPEPVSIPLVITTDMRQQLCDLGYSNEDIDGMAPEDAGKLIEAQFTKPFVRTPVENNTPQSTEPTSIQAPAKSKGGAVGVIVTVLTLGVLSFFGIRWMNNRK